MSDDTLFFDVAKALYAQVKSNWATLPVFSDNDDARSLTLNAGFVRVYTEFDMSAPASINDANPRIRTLGFLCADVHTPQNAGTGPGLNYAGQIATLLRGKSPITGLLLRAPTIRTSMQVSYANQPFWKTPLRCPFQYDRFVSIL